MRVRMRACLSNLRIFFFYPFVCMRSGREGMRLFKIFFLLRPSSVEPWHGLSRMRIKEGRKEKKVLPQLIWPLQGWRWGRPGVHTVSIDALDARLKPLEALGRELIQSLM